MKDRRLSSSTDASAPDRLTFRAALQSHSARLGIVGATVTALVAIAPGDLTTVRANELRNCEESGALVCPERGSELDWHTDPIPYIVSPRRTGLLDRRPMLAWARIPDAESYTIELIDGITGERLFSVLAPATIERLVYPESAPDLSPDTFYRLEVTANTGAASWQAKPNGGIAFDVLSDERAIEYDAALQALTESGETIDPVALAELQHRFGLYQDAVETYRAALDADRANPTLTPAVRAELLLRLAEVYWNDLQLVPEAAALYEETYAIAPTAALAEQLGTSLLLLGDRDRALEYWDAAIAGYLTLGEEADAQRVRAERDRIRGGE